MPKVILKDINGGILEEIKINHLEKFILYRGRLFENINTQVLTATYIQRQYLEIY